MTTPREPSGSDRGRWDAAEYPPSQRHPGYDRYPPPNVPRRNRDADPDRPGPPRTRRLPIAEYEQGRAEYEQGRYAHDRNSQPDPAAEQRNIARRPGRFARLFGASAADDPPAARTGRSTDLPPRDSRTDSAGRGHYNDPPADDPTGAPPTRPYETVGSPTRVDSPGARRIPRKLTVTRVAAMRGRELTEKGIATFQRAAKADGADKSGLTALTYATMANFALDAAIAVALANTLFFASATAESKTKVALYLLITIAPFAVIAPLIGPMLDRLQRGRRLALASSFALRAVVAVVLLIDFDSWALYPLALCMMVLSKSFAVLKSAVTPRVLPPGIDLVRTNSRLTVFGLVGGTLGAGGVAGAAAALFGSGGALCLAVVIAVGGTYLSLRIPRWVEVTEGEVPATLGYHAHDPHTEVLSRERETTVPPRKRRQPLGREVVTGLWGNSAIRVLTGFLTFYVAFVAKATEHRPVQQAAMLGLVGAAAAIGNFAGNATGARLKLGRPALIVLNCTAGCTVVTLFAIFADSLFGAAVAALVAAGASALAKVSLDAAIQDDLPPESIASGFGRSETVLQLSWVIGGAAGVLLPTDYWKGFAVVGAVLVLGLVQSVLSYRGHSLLPGLGGNRPQHAEQEITVPLSDIPRGDSIR
ncbi:MFS transporter [Nocardia paucivorans]|uniref:MFS transporter n=1 Tax=Nocardia paucivorans TaxID=114259 RepID=UPI0002E695F0|nr:MFS transporter [Nocardia paucivorans]